MEQDLTRPNKQHLLSRRQHLLFLANAGAALWLNGINEDVKIPRESNPNTLNSYAETFWHSFGARFGALGSQILVDSVAAISPDPLYGETPKDAKGLFDVFKNHSPLEVTLLSCVYGPMVEETLFRLVPSALITKITEDNQKPHWYSGIVSSLAFGLVHILYRDSEKRLKFMKYPPVTHSMIGLWLWSVMRSKGYGHAVFGHASLNSVALMMHFATSKKRSRDELTIKEWFERSVSEDC